MKDIYDELDLVDRKILDLLENHARMSAKEIADRINIAPSTCIARIKSLQNRGIILRYKTEINLQAIGKGLQALISIRLHSHARAEIGKFQSYLKRLTGVRAIFFVTGDLDFLVHVAVKDTDELRELVSNTLSLRPEVAATNTSVIFEHTPL